MAGRVALPCATGVARLETSFADYAAQFFILGFPVVDVLWTCNANRAGAQPYVRLKVRTNNGVEVPIGQNTGCP
jgi:hypothetical protein